MRFELKKTGKESFGNRTFIIPALEEARRPQGLATLKIDHLGGSDIYADDIFSHGNVTGDREFLRQFHTSPARWLLLHAVKDHGSEQGGCIFTYAALTSEGKRMTAKLLSQEFFETRGTNFFVSPEKVKIIKQIDLANPKKEQISALFKRR